MCTRKIIHEFNFTTKIFDYRLSICNFKDIFKHEYCTFSQRLTNPNQMKPIVVYFEYNKYLNTCS